MNSYDYGRIIDSYCHDEWWWEDSPSSSNHDANYYHYPVQFKLVHETEKAYLLGSKQGEFWCPKSLLRDVKIKKDTLTAILWKGFTPEFKKPEKPINVFDAFADIDKEEAKVEKKREKIQKKLDKRLKKEKKKKKVAVVSTPTGVDNWFLSWLGVGK